LLTQAQEGAVPFDGTVIRKRRLPKRDPSGAQSALVLDMAAFFFQDGKLWTRQHWKTRAGARCLVEAVRFVRQEIGSRDDRALGYLARAIRESSGDWRVGGASQDLIVGYNDTKGRTYAEIADVLRRAKQLAEADAQCVMT